MPAVTIEEAQAKLPELIDHLRPGQEVIITRNSQPVAKVISQLRNDKGVGNLLRISTSGMTPDRFVLRDHRSGPSVPATAMSCSSPRIGLGFVYRYLTMSLSGCSRVLTRGTEKKMDDHEPILAYARVAAGDL